MLAYGLLILFGKLIVYGPYESQQDLRQAQLPGMFRNAGPYEGFYLLVFVSVCKGERGGHIICRVGSGGNLWSLGIAGKGRLGGVSNKCFLLSTMILR